MSHEHCASDNIYKYIMELIPSCPDCDTLLQKIFQRYQMPLILTDISYHLIAYAGPSPCPDPLWEKIITAGTAPADTIINGYYKDGYMDRISVEPEPFCVDWGISAGALQTTCAVYVNGNMEAISSVLFLDPEKKELALTVNAAFRSAAEIYLTLHPDRTMGSPAPYRAFVARLLLEDTKAAIETLYETSFFKQISLTPGYLVLALQLRSPVAGRLQNLRSGIKNRYPTSLYLTKEDGVYLFFSGMDKKKVAQLRTSIAEEAEGKADYVCGISEIFTDLTHRAAYVEQAKLALSYGIGHCSESHDYDFAKFYAPIVCQVGSANLHKESLVLPEIRVLQTADRENSTNFFESLKCFLYTRGDMSKTAAKLFLHRNSLMYRIKRCQEIMDVDILDQQEFERLYICCRLLDQQETRTRA